MRLYRISSCKYIDDLTGTGGLYADGRWHEKGTRILYTSERVSLAKLETLANSVVLPKNQCLLTIELPNDIMPETVDIHDLPKDWGDFPYTKGLVAITKRWIDQNQSLLLKVPSAQASGEYNVLINPQHQDVAKIKIISTAPIKFDQRLKF